MNDCYLSLLLNFRALLSIDSGANLVNSKQAIGVILPDLSLLGYAVPVESFGIGLFIVLFAYLAVEYNVQLLSHEKLKIAMNMLHTTYTPLILLRNQLEELKTGNLPESLSQQVEEALGYTEYIIYCNQNIVTLNKVNKKILPKTSTANLELSSYITSIVNQCRPYADSRRIQLTVSECSDCVSCRINENIMTAALQHLISKLILGSDLGCCISINITHTTDSWQLQITNCEIADKRVGKMFPFIPVIFPIYGYSDLWTVRKIIRLHGGKINGYRHGKSFAFQIVIPTDCHCRNQECSAIKHSSTNTKNKAKKSSESDKDDTPNAKTKDTSHILLVMADGAFRNYLKKALSRYFQISALEDPDLLKDTVVRQNPDAIIIDDNVNGTNGDTLSFRIKTDKMIGYIPVVLLIRAFDNESYLSHLGSGADRLELRTESICRLRANIRMLVENRMVLRERVKLFLSDAVFPMVPTKEEMETENTDQIFMDKVNKILEKNISTDKYTIDKLSIDIGMSFDGHFTVPEQIQFETYRQVSENSNVADNDIYVLYKDTDSQIWVSVFGGGLNRLVRYDKEKREPIFKSYGIREGMNNDVVKSIVEDKNGNLWFTTEIGLSCFNKATEQFRNYDKYDGFLNVELEEGSALRTLNGDLWIGTRQGILTFSPDKLETLHTNYDTRIVDFKVSNRDLRSFRECPILKESITYAKAIELNYNQSMFTIEFAALNFYNQNGVSYRYILEGYEKEWHYNGKNRIASYTNVPPGDYTFRVETVDEANPELVSNCTLAITILPPWWLSWWATLIYVILGLAALYFSLRLAFFMLKMKNDIYIEQKVSEMKIKFFTNISHELRTPLTLIKGPIQELREREKLSPKGLQYVDLMEKNTNQMLQLVNQILDFRKIQNGKMRLHVSLIDFNEMIASFQKEFRVLSEENEISFTFQLLDEPIMVWADKEKMSIVIRNIISNAFKFTHSGGSIYITTGLTDDGKRCYVRVEDNGVGIPQNKLTEIFERFSQGENAKNSYYQGTGIGLALSKEIVNLHHGQIRAESPEGQGAVFIVELLMDKEHYRPSEVDFYVGDTETAPIAVEQDPVANAISEDGTEEEEPEIDASLPTLLLVEDNKDLCQLIKLQLEDKFNIHIANNGVEGLKKIHLYHPDIVVTDQMMPEMDGLEMLQSIRKDFQISHIPVIILTAKNDEGAKTKAITLGANAYITKPFSKEYLLARIDQLLAERKLFRERIRQQMENQTTTEEDSYEQFLVKKDVQFLEKIHQVIEENMDDSDFNIDTIASGIGLSRSAFFKKLKSLTGLAPVDLVKEIRLNKSIELIKNTDLSVSEIAFAVGFKDSGYYSKCFRKKYNQSPREYMNEWRKGER